ncbi:MAG: ATP synthase F0 subunit A [Candidatus Omnitrophica bacterium CG11_big_fil_rev_8_21_14_0_20_45_26]|uniref:ATP synthase subunit a n=1 Tax=Candidatus Abzuiibacterium crystallinum TaxID=1974748 RepID=A0A2H0LM50_9BACT|nr:MAG: ATP synthase F0 subunit A [Candidatus Omnitrophica bacterium CG11_big_fil_rev_8_21_14_0_20_45_26]PIW63690.1 MAG: ATP synthase F0 subunit A [Candidatus Omnitrophica bacterium CG12_big_fil_rev_8_21_14_0_65_45_16]
MIKFAYAASEHAAETVHETAHLASEHAAQTEHAVKHLANFLTPIIEKLHGTPLGDFLHRWETVIFSWLAAIVISIIFTLGSRKQTLIPEGFQNFIETIVEAMENMVTGIIGSKGRAYVPFIGTLFIYIFVQNWLGLVPGMMSPTTNINTTAGLAICVFFYVQFIGLRENGLKGYLLHLMGSPNDAIGWCMVPLNLPLHILEEFIRPLSLALRLFGNIFGEETLIAVFAGFGILALSFFHSPVGLPLQVPFMMLSMLLGTIQALVFALLSTIYIALMLPHDHEETHAHT